MCLYVCDKCTYRVCVQDVKTRKGRKRWLKNLQPKGNRLQVEAMHLLSPFVIVAEHNFHVVTQKILKIKGLRVIAAIPSLL